MAILTPALLAAALLHAESDPIQRAIDLMGGAECLRRLSAIRVKGLVTLGLNEQVERYTGPIPGNVLDFDWNLELGVGKVSGDYRWRGAQSPDWVSSKLAADFGAGTAPRGGGVLSTLDLSDLLALNPVRVLLYAQAAANRLRLPRIREGSETYDRIRYGIGEREIVLWFRSTPGNLDRIEVDGPRDRFWSAWKTVRSVTQMSNWQRLPGGAWYPYYAQESRNGVRYAEWNLTEVTPSSGPEAPAEALRAEQARLTVQAKPLDVPLPKLESVAPGLWRYPGVFPCEVVDSDAGLVVIDAPYGQAFSERVLADLGSRFPSKPVRALVATDPYWPHQAGFLSYVKRGIPIFTEVRNAPLLRDLASNWSVPLKGLRTVERRSRLAEGIEVVPIEGVASERFLSVWLPGTRMLFCSDTVTWMSKSELYNSGAALDVARLIERERLNVDKVLATHTHLDPWSRIKAALEGRAE